MDFSPKDFVTPDEIIADVTRRLDDEGFDLLPEGWYVSQMQQALQELAYDTFFDVRYEEFEIPKDLRLPIPAGSFNIKEVWVFNGNKCNINSPGNVYWKRNYFTGGNGYVANDHSANTNDPFYKNRSGSPRETAYGNTVHTGDINTVRWFNVVNGVIMLSSSCLSFQKIMLKFNGTGCAYGDKPVIPNFLQQAVKGWVLEQAYPVKIAKSPREDVNRWITLQNSNSASLRGRRREEDGDWYKAEIRVKSMSSKQRSDLKEYNSKLDY